MSAAVVYIQLQNDLPPCFWVSLKKTRALWGGPIFLVAPQRELGHVALEKMGVTFVAQESFGGSVLSRYESSTFFNDIHKGWNGFWDNACKRFVYMHELQRQTGMQHFLYMEADVVPYISIDSMMRRMQDEYPNKLVFSDHAPHQTSCCTMYCNSPTAMHDFCEAIIGYFKRGPGFFHAKHPSQTILNETHFANLFREENPCLTDLLPTIPGDDHHDALGFLVDSTAWGMWVDGLQRDPHTPFATENHNIGKQILAGKWDVQFQQNGHGEKIPYVLDKSTGETHQLATVHFNSKMPDQWI